MGYVLGIDLGTSRTAAAIFRNGRADVIPLSDHAATMPSMVFVRDDASVVVGEAARRRGHEDPSRLAREFKRRFGDTTPLVLGNASLTAEQLTATLLKHVVDHVSAREGGLPDRVVVAHPANWGTYRRELLRAELAGLPRAQLVSEPDAAAVHFASGERQAVGDIIAVYDLGGGTFDAAVLRRTATGFEQVGEPKGIERLGGIDFDEAVFQHVASVSGLDAATTTDADLPALLRLRDDCQSAKEALSDDLEVSVPVMVAGINTRVRITRAELETMIRPALKESVACLKAAIKDAGLTPHQVSAILMVGGSSRIPLAAEMVRIELERPVVFTSNPKEAVALGAARIGGGGGGGGGGAAAEPSPAAAVVEPGTVAPTAPVPPLAPLAPLAPVPPVAAVPPVPPVAPVAPAAVRHVVPVVPAPVGDRRRWVIPVAAVLSVAAGIGGALAITSGDDAASGTTRPNTVATTRPAVTTSDPASSTSTSEAGTTTPLTAASTTAAPPSTAAPTSAAPVETFALYSPVPTVDFALVPTRLEPPASASDPIADGRYFGFARAPVDASGLPSIDLQPAFFGQDCENEAAADGQECFPPYVRNSDPYLVALDPDAFVSVNNSDINRNLRITVAELLNLVEGGDPSPGAPDVFTFGFAFIVDVTDGKAVRLQGFFTP